MKYDSFFIQNNQLKMFFTLIKQEFLIHIKNLASLTHSLIFFLITASIFAILANIGNAATALAIIWICLTFSILLACSGQFQSDFNDGTFEQLYLSGYVFEVIILAKILANWLFNIVPLIIFLPVIALILKIPNQLMINLILVATIASLLINFLVSLGSALILSAKNTSSLLTILILPLLIPAIIFANSALSGGDLLTSTKILSGLIVFLIPILTFATASAVKINIID
jgi:heme exporter protein B